MITRHWGIAITVFYALAVAFFLLPAVFVLGNESWPSLSQLSNLYTDWVAWIWIVILVGGQALLLFLSVDSSHRRLKPRQHVLVSISLAGLLFSILSLAAITSLFFAIFEEAGRPEWMRLFIEFPLAWLLALWLLWIVFFYLYLRDSSRLVTRLATWLLRGSVLELLIAIPCHLIVRQRDECTSPAVTGFGVVTGIAIMLLSFGPSVLLLYKKRLDQYQK